MNMKLIIKYGCVLTLFMALTACDSNRTDNDGVVDSATLESDTSLMDTTISTGTGTDTIEQKLKEGDDGTGKPSTDPRTRKQQ